MNVGYIADQQQGEQSAVRFLSAGERTGPSRLSLLRAKHLPQVAAFRCHPRLPSTGGWPQASLQTLSIRN